MNDRSPAGTASSPLQVAALRHAYQQGLPPVVTVDEFSLPAGATVALTGPSGSGKTTLAYLLSGIERVRQGSVRWGQVDLATLPEAARDRWRRRHAGFVFQDFHLIGGLSIMGNVLVSCWFDQWRVAPAQQQRAAELLDRFGVPVANRRIEDLSRGEQQRVAIARALLRNPAILIADEPTASLDSAGGAAVIEILLAEVRRSGATLLAVTHDPQLIAAVATVYRLDHGRLDRSR
jgi:putative ABC transport system ATP-binding protein